MSSNGRALDPVSSNGRLCPHSVTQGTFGQDETNETVGHIVDTVTFWIQSHFGYSHILDTVTMLFGVVQCF